MKKFIAYLGAIATIATAAAAHACPVRAVPLAARVPLAALADASKTPVAGHWEWQGDGHVWVEDSVRVSRARDGSHP